jgi:hypothetical protein
MRIYSKSPYAVHISTNLIAGNFIVDIGGLNAKNCHIAAFCDIFADLIDFTEWQYSMLQSVLNDLESSVEYGTIQLLSIKKLFPFTFFVVVRLISLGDRRQYSG